MGAPTPDLPPIHDDGGVDGHRVGFQGPGLRTLTLDLPTLGISGPEREGGRGEARGRGELRSFVTRTAGLGGRGTWGQGVYSRDLPGETLRGQRPRKENRILVPKQI